MKILDNTYKNIKDSRNKKGISFDDIYKSLGLEDDAYTKGNVYSGIHFDHRFIMVGNNKWSARDLFTAKEVDDIQSYNMNQSDLLE